MRERKIFEKHPMASIPAVPSTPGSFAQANPFSGPLIPLEALIQWANDPSGSTVPSFWHQNSWMWKISYHYE